MQIAEILAAENNVAAMLGDSVLTEIGSRVVEEYASDLATMSGWVKMNKLAMELVSGDVKDRNGANTTLPLVLTAVQRATAEEYPEIVRDDDLVKTKLFGKIDHEKEGRAHRVAKRLNHQFLHKMKGWVDDHDRLTFVKNLLGCVHKKLYYDAEAGTCVSKMCLSGIVVNDGAPSIEEAARITDEIELHRWQVVEKQRSGSWLTTDLPDQSEEGHALSDKTQTFLEQIRREDLDEDGYSEPYIVTVHKASRKVVRITPNYTAESVSIDAQGTVLKINPALARIRYVKYQMLPSPDGGYWAWGLGRLLAPLNDNCNSIVNQLLDAGRLQNEGGGFISQQFRLGKGEVDVEAGKWHSVPAMGGAMRDSIVPFPIPQPSPTLFSLLGLLMESLRDLSSVSRVMSGEQPRSNMPGISVIALIEQGKKAMGSIYQRHYHALTQEAEALFDLNFQYEDPAEYQEFLDDPVADPKRDFERGGIDVVPTANPKFSTRIQRMAEAEALLPLAQDPRVNGALILQRYVEGITDDKELAMALVPAEPNKTPDQVIQAIQVGLAEFKAETEARKLEAEAQIAEHNVQIAALNHQIAALNAEKAGIEAPMKMQKTAASADRAGLQVVDTQLKVVGTALDNALKEKQLNAPAERKDA